MQTAVRLLTAGDYAQWWPLWADYVRFYQADVSDAVTDCTWRRLTGGCAEMAALGAFDENGALCGFAHTVRHFNTWDTRQSCYLEDLFVSEAFRQRGLGRALIEAVYRLAAEHRCCRVYWVTHFGNAAAQRLYDGMAERMDLIQYRKDWDE